MTPLLMHRRASGRERLDDAFHDPHELRVNLSHLAGVNRWLGGERSVLPHIRRALRTVEGSVTVLDVGTGGADLPRSITRLADRYGLRPIMLALDRQRSVAAIAGERTRDVRSIYIIVGDGLSLPLSDKSVDIAMSSTTLHHLSTDDAVDFIREMGRVARNYVVVGDLDRNPLALLGAHVLAHTWWRRSNYRFDGPLSVKKAFTKLELLHVGMHAGLQSPRVHRHFPFRLALVGQPPS